MNDEQLKVVIEVLRRRFSVDRFQAMAVAVEAIEAYENKATPPPRVATAVTAIKS